MNSPAIENMRSRTKNSMLRPSLNQVQEVVDGLSLCRSLYDTATAASLTPAQVLDITASLGTWLTHVSGGQGAPTRPIHEVAQLPLFQFFVAPPSAPDKPRRGRPKKAIDRSLVIPQGYYKEALRKDAVITGEISKRDVRRDVTKAVAAVIAAAPDEDTLGRFLSRKYQSQARVLSYAHVVDIWMFAKLGRLGAVNPDLLAEKKSVVKERKAAHAAAASTDKVLAKQKRIFLKEAEADLNRLTSYHLDSAFSASDTLAELYVESYDLLSVAREDAVKAVHELLKEDTSDLDRLGHTVQKCKWLAEAEMDQLMRAIDGAKTDSRRLGHLQRELHFFAQRAKKSALYFPRDIADLTQGNVLRICQNAGIQVEDDAESRKRESDVRAKLKLLNLGKDIDQLTATGAQAEERGRGEEFWEIIQERQSGNAEWYLMLQELQRSF